MSATIHSVHDFPMNVSTAWLAPLVNIANTTCVINIKNVSTFEARSLMDKAITEVRTQMLNKKQIFCRYCQAGTIRIFCLYFRRDRKRQRSFKIS